MKKNLILILSLMPLLGLAQNTTFGSQTDLLIQRNAEFYFGGNTTFTGVINNEGEIVASSDLDFSENELIGDVRLIGRTDQVIKGDTIVINNLTLEKQGSLTLESNQLIVEQNLTLISGIIDAEFQEEFVLNGDLVADASSGSYVAGDLIVLTRIDEPVDIPVGVSGFSNFMTITSDIEGVEVRIECKIPDPNQLSTDSITQGLSDEVEWTIQTLNEGETVEVSVGVNFSGVDLNNLANGQTVNADQYATTLQLFDMQDSVFHALVDQEPNFSRDLRPSTGGITSTDKILVTNEPQRLAIGISPIQLGPVFYVPNAFSPGASRDENKVFRPYYTGSEISSYRVIVFDSFNKEVYSAQDSGSDLDITAMGWDGVLPSGLEAPEGVYYYRISLSSAEDNINKIGSVLLVK